MCGGTAESDLDSLAAVSLKAKEVMSEAQKESQQEYKEAQNTPEEKTTVNNEETTSASVLEKKLLWGATDAKPEVYAAEDVSQATIDLTVEWVNKAIGHWGSYGPLEIWIVGTGKDEVIALDEKWCDVRTEKDPT